MKPWWLGPAFVAGALAVHCAFAPRPGRDLRLAGVLLLVGGLADALMVTVGAVDYGVAAPRLVLVPFWILALWPLFASTFHTTLAWLQTRPLLAALLGLLGGPPGYLAADRFGALRLGAPVPVSLLLLGLAWAVVMPLGLWLARRQNVPAPTPAAEVGA
jgi:hypothetical protein